MAKSNEKKNENVSDKQDNQNQIEYRVEIICNQSIQDDVIELLEQEIQNIQYTIIENVNGKGLSSKKLGNTTWPEMNFLLFAYTDLSGAKKIKIIVEVLKKKFPQEGISIFFSNKFSSSFNELSSFIFFSILLFCSFLHWENKVFAVV